MDSPDRMRNKRGTGSILAICPWDPVMKTITQEKASTIMVRTAVATVESVVRMPHFAKMAVSPAKTAEPKAKSIHMFLSHFLSQHTHLALQQGAGALLHCFPDDFNQLQHIPAGGAPCVHNKPGVLFADLRPANPAAL